MTSRLPAYIAHSFVAFGVTLSPGGLLSGGVLSELTGTEPFRHDVTADKSCPEELAAFYDDLDHDVRTWSGLFRCALEDVIRYQPKLF